MGDNPSPSARRRISNLQSAGVAAAVLLCVVLVCARIVAHPPTLDEALVAVPAWTLAHRGFPGTTVLVNASSPWQGIERRTYNTLPVGILYLASWFAVFPATILATRIALALWGPVLLLGCFVFFFRLTGNRQSAVLATVLLGLNYGFVFGTAQARVDVITAALGMAAFASYIELRLLSLRVAALVSATFAVFACLTHPQGVLYASGLVILAVRLDRRSLSTAHFAVAALPFAICGSLWLWYVAQDSAGAIAQLRVNLVGQGRFPISLNPLRAVRREVLERYLEIQTIPGRQTWIWRLILTLIPLASGAGILLIRPLRRQSGLRLILLLTASFVIIQTLFDNSKFHVYLIHVRIFYSALIGAFAIYSCRAGLWQRRVAAFAVGTYILINLGGVAYGLRGDLRTRGAYRAALSFLQARVSPHDLVIGDSSLWFDCCGPGHNLIQDSDLGITSGLSPDFLVNQGQESALDKYRKEEPILFDAIRARFSEFDLIYDYEGFRIYHRR